MVEVLKEFFDLKENVLRKVGTTFETDEARRKEHQSSGRDCS